VLSASTVFSQQPAFFKLGEDQFRGIQVYDVIQDNDLNYWFATNEGLYKYNFYSFTKVECSKAKSNSVFNFVKDTKGVIYCHNLNKQVFKIADNECTLLYEIRDNEVYSDVSLTIGDDGNLLIGAKKLIVINSKGEVQKRYEIANHFLGQPFTTKDLKIHYHLNHCDSILEYSQGILSPKKLTIVNSGGNELDVFKFFSISNNSYAIELKTKKVYSYQLSQLTLTPIATASPFEQSGSIRIYETKGKIWVAGTLPGVNLLSNITKRTSNAAFYADYFISNVFEDHEGNILLSTFDKGILVVSDLKVADVINTFRDDPITSLYPDEELGLLLGSSKGKLLAHTKQTASISEEGDRPINGIYGFPKSDLIIYDDGQLTAYNKKTKIKTVLFVASLKGAKFVSDKEIYLGTNKGICKVTWLGGNKFETTPITSLSERVHFVEYNSKNKWLYTSTANGVFTLLPNGQTKEIRYKGSSIFPNDLFYANGKIYASTKENGVLVITNGAITRVFQPMVNGKKEVLKKIIVHNNTLFARTTNGFYQFDLNGELLKSIHSMFGFSSQRVIDFTFLNSELWVSHTGGVQKIDLNYYASKKSKTNIQLIKVLVNNKPQSMAQSHVFNAQQRKIQFIFSSPTLRNRQTIRYYYQLVGYDKEWNINEPNANQITYNALSPGKYTFLMKAENQGVFSETVAYSFEIASPIYARWWFIVLVILLFLGLVYLIFKRQLAIQRKKSQQINELNASKLTAIQSQMNPHFIFNSLNSIQDLILKGDVEHSYSYITTFSNLVRRTLNYSEKDFIDFDQEIKLLELYLSLEKLRFKKDFSYTIHCENIDDIMIPPLLIQPFIENALVHGLLHKEGEKRLTITFEMGENLKCIIEDNGIGREKAKAIKVRQRSEHESFSGKAIHNRFEILSNVFEGKFGYTYEDLYENTEGIGTKVTLWIPIKHTY
jgi:ligand-binding sensor domain-containing protein